jgi:polysaccharide chain length determinant protein (PEP-CTERM system associated)
MDREDVDAPSRSFSAILKRRWPYVATIAPAIILLSIYGAFAIPALYRSSATIMLEPSSVQKDLVETTVASYADKQIEIVQGKVMTIPALSQLVSEFDPYPQEKALSTEEKALQIIENTSFERVDPVTLKVLVESTAFSLHYDNPDPKRAAKVASMISQLFLTYNQRSREDSAKQTAAFLAEQAKGVTEELQRVDAQLAQMKQKYGDAAPESQLRNEANLDRAQRDLDQVNRDTRAAEEKENLLALQLSQISPNLVMLGGDLTDLATVRAQLAEAERRYTPDHPDVKRLRRVMEDLIARNAASGKETVAKANNPEYLRVESQLKGARSELSALRAAGARINAQITQYMQNIGRSPTAEKEFSDVERRHAALQTQFQGLQERLRNAQLAQSFESESRGERFTMVRAPFAARLPVYPNRIGLILLGLVLGGGLTAVAVAIAESADPNVRGSSDLAIIPGVPVLGSIPVILTSEDRRKRMLLWGSVSAVYAVAIVAVGLTIASSS